MADTVPALVGPRTVEHKSYARNVLTSLDPLDGFIDAGTTRNITQSARDTRDLAWQSSELPVGATNPEKGQTDR